MKPLLLLLLIPGLTVLACPLCSLVPARAPAGYVGAKGAEVTRTIIADAVTNDALLTAFAELATAAPNATATWIECQVAGGEVRLIVRAKTSAAAH